VIFAWHVWIKQEEAMLGILSRRDKGGFSQVPCSGRLCDILGNMNMSPEELQQKSHQ
jgi:hypothetical protein